MSADSEEFLSIPRISDKNDPMKKTLPQFVQYTFTPGLGFYVFGLIHLLGNLIRPATANVRQLIDS
jgi:hypothetical protein